MTQDERLDKYYEIVQQRFRSELSLLFQRFNFFLIGNSFLVTAAAALAASAGSSGGSLAYLVFTIIVLGGLISEAFFIINYINAEFAKIISETTDRRIKKYDRRIKKYGKSQLPSQVSLTQMCVETEEEVREEIRKQVTSFKQLCKDLLLTMGAIFFNPLEVSTKRLATHTWLIPLAFYLFWLSFAAIIQFTWHWNTMHHAFWLYLLVTFVLPVLWLSCSFHASGV